MPQIGIPLGVLIGIVSGISLILLIRTSARMSERPLRTTLALIGEILAIPTFWFGGPWITQRFLTSVDLEQIVSSYVLSLAITFVLIAFYPLTRLVIRFGNDIGSQQRPTND